MKHLIAFLLLGCSLAASADEASQRKLADELVGVLRVDSQVRDWRQRLDAQAIETINKTLQGKTEAQLSAAQKTAIQNFSTRANAELDAGMNWDRLKAPASKIYQDAFAESELRELLQFYKSPTGQKLLLKEPQLADATGQMLRAQVQSMLPALQQIGQNLTSEYARPAATAAVPAPLAQPAAKPVAPALQPAAAASALDRCAGINPRTGRPC